MTKQELLALRDEFRDKALSHMIEFDPDGNDAEKQEAYDNGKREAYKDISSRLEQFLLR